MADARAKAQKLIDENNVDFHANARFPVVFSKTYCPYCRQAKGTLNSFGAEYALYELDELSDGSALQDALEDITGQRTVPNILIKGKHIGGNSDLQSLRSADKLEDLLRDAGALKA
ncbi:glutaredoxin [Paramyrothecium foliicola]|nr:glutaredoxin [Paramyrothecium foliicola]